MVVFTPALIFLGGPALLPYWCCFTALFVKLTLFLWTKIPPPRACGFTRPGETKALELQTRNYKEQVGELGDDFKKSRELTGKLYEKIAALEQEAACVGDLRAQISSLQSSLNFAWKNNERSQCDWNTPSSTLRSNKPSHGGGKQSLFNKLTPWRKDESLYDEPDSVMNKNKTRDDDDNNPGSQDKKVFITGNVCVGVSCNNTLVLSPT